MRLKKVAYAFEYLQRQASVLFLNEKSTYIDLSGWEQIELEIGCGKGDFILSRAQQYPDTMFFAIEKYDSVLVRAVEKQVDLALTNICFILGDANDLLAIFPPASIHKIYLNFSDPWPKKKHIKRRLTYTNKLQSYQTMLAAGGHIEMKTDNRGLFEYSLCELSACHWLIDSVCVDLYATDLSAYPDVKRHQTEYEKRFILKQQIIYFLQASRR